MIDESDRVSPGAWVGIRPGARGNTIMIMRGDNAIIPQVQSNSPEGLMPQVSICSVGGPSNTLEDAGR